MHPSASARHETWRTAPNGRSTLASKSHSSTTAVPSCTEGAAHSLSPEYLAVRIMARNNSIQASQLSAQVALPRRAKTIGLNKSQKVAVAFLSCLTPGRRDDMLHGRFCGQSSLSSHGSRKPLVSLHPFCQMMVARTPPQRGMCHESTTRRLDASVNCNKKKRNR